ncbi:class I SAM-dependent methyltransferase [Flaviflagellibacter deserti]|jgi:NADH dehydrogenase [ubiquinone] 1 alpha subcomplex assembly factor 7|uniref:Class I SAM-dependent methyltransferase n=1 Tax=Flaviflagellibacter deserti TaxID=2267266 RepID=A0ABV9YX14_9HYPH
MTPVEADIHQRIAIEGPLSVARVVGLANAHYYATRDPLGATGDFTTSPEISQMFGELLGILAAVTWSAMGSPASFRLVELGPGRGTLMSDALRAAGIVPGFINAASVHLVETSPTLRAAQARTLTGIAPSLSWHDAAEDIPDGPLIVIANEFFDALPIQQFVRIGEGWHERVVGLTGEKLAFGLSPQRADALVPSVLRGMPAGSMVETSPASLQIVRTLASRIARDKGAVIVIDYGHAQSGAGDTLQAVRDHQFTDVLTDLGAADLTAHVDFSALAAAGQETGVDVLGPTTQREFLLRMGLANRAAILKEKATPEQRVAIDAAFDRLTDAEPTGMGSLFKVLALTSGLPPLPGFEDLPE